MRSEIHRVDEGRPASRAGVSGLARTTSPLLKQSGNSSPERGTEVSKGPLRRLRPRSTGKHLKFTNLDKIWFPNDGITKRDILNYYDAVADWIVPHLAGHRCP